VDFWNKYQEHFKNEAYNGQWIVAGMRCTGSNKISCEWTFVKLRGRVWELTTLLSPLLYVLS
jgi:hypothetical protein